MFPNIYINSGATTSIPNPLFETYVHDQTLHI